MLAIRGVNHRRRVAFNAITVGYSWVVLLKESNFGIANLYNISRTMLFERNFCSKSVKIDGEVRLPHLFTKYLFDLSMPAMKYDAITRRVRRGKEWNTLNMIVMEMRKKNMESGVTDFLSHEFFSKYSQTRASIKDEIIV